MKSNHALEEFFGMLERIRAYNPTVAGVRELAATLFENVPSTSPPV